MRGQQTQERNGRHGTEHHQLETTHEIRRRHLSGDLCSRSNQKAYGTSWEVHCTEYLI
jgi:hypothetical protein